MFLTFEDTRLPFPPPGSRQGGWDLLEVPLRRIFFLVDVATLRNGKSIVKTFLLGSLNRLEEMIDGQIQDLFAIQCVYVITPEKISGVYPWKMNRLAKLYKAQDLKQPDFTCRVFETSEGKRFVDPLYGATLDDLGDLKEICDLSRG